MLSKMRLKGLVIKKKGNKTRKEYRIYVHSALINRTPIETESEYYRNHTLYLNPA